VDWTLLEWAFFDLFVDFDFIGRCRLLSYLATLGNAVQSECCVDGFTVERNSNRGFAFAR
jgi:hypothetical protein